MANFCEIRFLLLEGRWYNVIEHQDVGLQNWCSWIKCVLKQGKGFSLNWFCYNGQGGHTTSFTVVVPFICIVAVFFFCDFQSGTFEESSLQTLSLLASIKWVDAWHNFEKLLSIWNSVFLQTLNYVVLTFESVNELHECDDSN